MSTDKTADAYKRIILAQREKIGRQRDQIQFLEMAERNNVERLAVMQAERDRLEWQLSLANDGAAKGDDARHILNGARMDAEPPMAQVQPNIFNGMHRRG